MLKKLLLALAFLACCYSYSNAYDQQYQVGDTGPNGGEVTNVVVTSTITDTTSTVIGDFIEYTDTYLYQEVITENVASTTSTTTLVLQEIQTSNLLTTELQDTATMQNVYDCSTKNNCYGMGSDVEITTGNQSQNGGTAIVDFDLSTYNNMTELDYGAKVYSHSSNATVPLCSATNNDCKDEFKVTLTLKNGNSVVDTYVHNYTNMNWQGVQDYAFNQDVTNKTFDNASLEFYGIDRGYNTGFYGPGFSDAFLQVTYSQLVQQINNIINYTVMTTIKQTQENIIDSVYSPQPVIEFDFEPIEMEVDIVELSFDTSTNETMTFEIEVVEVDSVVEVNITSDFGGEMEVETIEVIDVVEILDMPDTSMEMEMPNIDMQMAELEIEMPEIELSMPEPEITVEPEVEVIEPEVEVDTATEPESMEPESMEPESMEPESMEPENMEPEPMEPESAEPESMEPEQEPEPETTEPEESNEPEPEPEEQSEPESRSEPEESDEQESDQKENKENKEKEKKQESKKEKIKSAVAKAKQKVAQKILAKIISANDTIALDNTKLALMIALSDTKGFSAYQEMQLQDIEFYLDNGLLDAYIPTNNIGQYYMFGGSDVLMNDLVDLQYQ